jgi:hypothetical protein
MACSTESTPATRPVGGSRSIPVSRPPDAIIPVEVSRAPPRDQLGSVEVDPPRGLHDAVNHVVVGHGHPQHTVSVGVIPVLRTGDELGEPLEERHLVRGRRCITHARQCCSSGDTHPLIGMSGCPVSQQIRTTVAALTRQIPMFVARSWQWRQMTPARHAPCVLRLAAIIAVCGLLVSCAEQLDQPTAAQETAHQERLPPLDEPVEYFLYAHCGVQPISLGGEWWHPSTVDGDEEHLSDYERGTLTVVSQSSVLFEGDEIEVEFEPGPSVSPSCR